ncbi:MAG: hypothetical protein KGI50_07660 [Patescibacteria group bacterium]|nr:hypothetical protein [Patescibacteria group bacterium]MDE2439047.1 hypothetical protein [Patescibacteria group bacterium]
MKLQSKYGLDELLKRLAITSNQIEQEALDQPLLFSSLANFYSSSFREMLRAKAKLEEREAELGILFRQKRKDSDSRITEREITDLVTKSKTVRELRKNYEEACEKEVYAKLLIDAYKMRRDSIRIVAEIRRGEMAQSGSGVSWEEEKLRRKQDELLRRRKWGQSEEEDE